MKKRALISLSDKRGAVEFAKSLEKLGYEIISTGGTAKTLSDNGIKVIGISDITGFPECLDGRVKTLHPHVHAGLLALRDNSEHMSTLQALNINTIDVLAVNLYPFKQAISKSDCTFMNAVENIDIGGPAMLRSAAKNFAGVLAVVDPDDYGEVINRLTSKTDDEEFRLSLMSKVFEHTAAYDSMIAAYLAKKTNKNQGFANEITLRLGKAFELRYGENPHQAAAFYREECDIEGTLDKAIQLQGKELSFNNLADAYAAIEIVKEFSQPAAVAIKHAAPCGVACADNLYKAYCLAHSCDPVSVFGGIVALNRTVDVETANEMLKTFLEVIIAPDYELDALEIFKAKPNVRLLKLDGLQEPSTPSLNYKRVLGGFLIQDSDIKLYDKLEVVTKKAPSEAEMQQLLFAFRVVKHTRSNAIVLARDNCAVGIAGGQTNRIWAANQAIERAGDKASGSVAASDAFFPFADCVEALAKAGVTAIIQPGGSIRDKDSIELCDKYNIAMIFTGIRHFKH